MSTDNPIPIPSPSSRSRRRSVSSNTRLLLILVSVGVVCLLLLFLIAAYFASPIRSSEFIPYQLTFGSPTTTVPAAGLSWISFAINPTPGLSTSYFALQIGPYSGAPLPSGEAPSSCTTLSKLGAGDCGVPVQGGWYAVLINNSTRSILNVYASGSWSSVPTILNLTMSLTVVSALSTSLTGSGDILSVRGTGGVSVIGGSGPL